MAGLEKLGITFMTFSLWLAWMIPYRDTRVDATTVTLMSGLLFVLGGVLFIVGGTK